MPRRPVRPPEVLLVGAFGCPALVLLTIFKLTSEIAEGDTRALGIFGASWALLCWTTWWWVDGRRKEKP